MIRWTAKTQRIKNSVERHIQLRPDRKNIPIGTDDFLALYDEQYHTNNKIHLRDDYYLVKSGVKYED